MRTTRQICLLTALLLLPLCAAYAQNFTWMRGNSTGSIPGTYGTQGITAPANNPGGRQGAATWTDASGNLWLFGGAGYNTVATLNLMNDLWRYNPSTNQWTWIRGSNGPNSLGVYGTQGVPSPANDPGAREFMITWTDAGGNFWMFGGEGYGSAGASGKLGDLWKYSPATNQWTWMKGPNITNVNGIYGTQTLPAAANFPGGRSAPGSWIDNTGRLWLYGGLGFGASSQGFLGDLWRYDPATNNWAWMHGGTGISIATSFGSMSVPAPSNAPGSREFPAFWKDAAGNLVMFGGRGYTGATLGYMGDMWTYNIATGNWTWIGGSSGVNQSGIYGSNGVPAAGNLPGNRLGSACWKDALGNYWLFGGIGYSAAAAGRLNDLWRYNPGTNQWTWMKGTNTIAQGGTYGIMGITAAVKIPGSRDCNTWWKDVSSNTFWLFGGFGNDMASNLDRMNDLWRYKVPCNPDSLVASPSALCSGQLTSLTAYNTYPASVTWFTVPSGGSSVATGPVLPQTLTATGTPATYTYYAMANTCTVEPRSAVVVTVYPLPQLVVAGPASVCTGSAATLIVSGASSYTWNNGATTTTTSAAPNSGLIVCQGEDALGCQNSVSYTLGAYPLPLVKAMTAKVTICKYETTVLTASGASSYTWNGTPGGTTLAISPITSTNYTLEGTDQNGCSNTFTITQFVGFCSSISETGSSAEEILIYPNPAQEAVHLSLPFDAEITISNQLGQTVLHTRLPAGLHLLETGLSVGVYAYMIKAPGRKLSTGKLIVK